MRNPNRYIVLCTEEQYELCEYNFSLAPPDFQSRRQRKLADKGIDSLLFKGIPLVTVKLRGYGIVDVRKLGVDGDNNVVYFGTMMKKWIKLYHQILYNVVDVLYVKG